MSQAISIKGVDVDKWHTTNYTADSGNDKGVCAICSKSNLRYRFLIKNSENKDFAYVGKDCLLQSKVTIQHDDKVIQGDAAKKHLYEMEKQATKRLAIKTLQELYRHEDNEIILNALDFYRKKGYITPKQAFVVLWGLDKKDINVRKDIFKIAIHRQRYKQDLLNMEKTKLKVILAALTKSQKKQIEHLL